MRGLRLITILIDSPIEPRWTGMCGALAIRPPPASKTAQEKSSRSLMLTECAVDCRRTPICSATDMNRLLKISSITGSAVVLTSDCVGRVCTRDSRRSPRAVTTACQPGSTTVVARSSAMIAGPSTACPGRSAARGYRSTSAHAPLANIATRVALTGRSGTGPSSLAERAVVSPSLSFSCAPVTSTETASTRIGLSRMRKAKRWAYSASNERVISASEATGTMRAVSVPA